MNLTELKLKPIHDLVKLAESMGLDNLARSRKQDIIFSILKAHARNGENIYGDGVLEILQDGFGFLRSADGSYLAGPADDIYVSPSQIRRFNLRTGDTISGLIRPPKDGERYFALLKVGEINYDSPDSSRSKVLFENLTPFHPTRRLKLERGNGSTEDLTARTIDLVAPIGKGQRGLIVSPPKAVRRCCCRTSRRPLPTIIPKSSSSCCSSTSGPEEVTEMQRTVKGEVVSSTFDEPRRSPRTGRRDGDREGEAPRRAQEGCRHSSRLHHTPRARLQHRGPLVGQGADRWCGCQRVATPEAFLRRGLATSRRAAVSRFSPRPLIDTGSKMDDVIYEEFKGTGNSEIHLDRRISEKRVFPAVNINRSGTRKEELITDHGELAKIWILRKLLHPMDELAAIEFLLDKMKDTKSNGEFFEAMRALEVAEGGPRRTGPPIRPGT